MKIWIMILCAIATSVSFGNASKKDCKKRKTKALLCDIDGDIHSVEEKMEQRFQEFDDKIKNLSQDIQQIIGKINELSHFVTNSSSPEPPQCNSDNNEPRYSNCYEILNDSSEPMNSGVYTIYPSASSKSKDVYCDMDTDGGGWSVIQRRGPYSPHIEFNRTWSSYVEGFGDLEAEFWLGLTTINALTQQGDTELRIDVEDFNSNIKYAHYGFCEIDDESNNYTLHIGSYKGNAGDSLLKSDGMQFSTLDKDNDVSADNCASLWSGAWWYFRCGGVNLNGVYNNTGHDFKNVLWYGFSNNFKALKTTEMKLRPSPSSSSA